MGINEITVKYVGDGKIANAPMDVRNYKTCHEGNEIGKQASMKARKEIEIRRECGLNGGGLCCKESDVNIGGGPTCKNGEMWMAEKEVVELREGT